VIPASRDECVGDQQFPTDISRFAICALIRFQQPCTRVHDMPTLLDAYAGRLAAHIGRTGHANPVDLTNDQALTMPAAGPRSADHDQSPKAMGSRTHQIGARGCIYPVVWVTFARSTPTVRVT
jgi:hypothetical protein